MRLNERWYNLQGRADFLLRFRNLVRSRIPEGLIATSLISAVDDAKEYLGISTERFFALAASWPLREEQLFSGLSVGDFYAGWRGDDAAANICANIINQHIDRTNFGVFSTYFSSLDRVADFGCGTGCLSFAFALHGRRPRSLHLFDVVNDVADFIDFRIRKHGLSGSVSFTDALAAPAESFDGVCCIDVLEHLPSASDVMRQAIHPRVAPGGLLYLKAPWRGQLTHIDAAPEDFYGAGGGRRFLRKNYNLICRAGSLDVMSVYRRREQSE